MVGLNKIRYKLMIIIIFFKHGRELVKIRMHISDELEQTTYFHILTFLTHLVVSYISQFLYSGILEIFTGVGS
jgi:hypothetical protein